MQRTAARTAVRYMLNEADTAFFTDTDLNNWIDDAVKDICSKTFCSQKIGDVFIISPTTTAYNYPTTVGTTTVVTLGIRALINTANESVPYVDQDLIGRTPVGTLCWTVWGRKIYFGWQPGVNQSVTPYIWTIVGCTADSVEFAIPQAYHFLVVLYVLYKAYQKRRSFELSTDMWKQYESEIELINDTLTEKFTILPQKQTVANIVPSD